MATSNSENDKSEVFEVQLYMYDLRRGLTDSILSVIIGKEVPEFWRTTIVAYNKEYFYGRSGIENCEPGSSKFEKPQTIISLGKTKITSQVFSDYINSLMSSSYAVGTCDLFNHNCNNFSNEISNFFFGKNITKEVLDLPMDFLQTRLGKIVAELLCYSTGQTDLSFHLSDSILDDLPQENSNVDKEAFIYRPYKAKGVKYSEKPITFFDLNINDIVNELKSSVYDKLSKEEKEYLDEWNEFLLKENIGWLMGSEHIQLFRKILDNENNIYEKNAPIVFMKSLQVAVQKNGFIILLHDDNEGHRLKSYFSKIESLDEKLQIEICKFFLNLCGLSDTFDWILYRGEWFSDENLSLSNGKMTVRVAIHCLLNEKNQDIQKLGLSLIWNIALKEVSDEIALELSTALLQYMHLELNEQNANMALTSLSRFMDSPNNEIGMLAKMLGPNLDKFKGISDINTQLVEIINKRISTSTIGLGY